MPSTIEQITAREIPDSRGVPTIEATVTLADGSTGTAAVPSGTSTGKHEAMELRDGDPAVANGKGVSKAIGNVTGELFATVKGQPAEVPTIDRLMIRADGTPNKHRLGANAILAVSFAVARAAAASYQLPLYRYLAEAYGRTLPTKLPAPLVNVFEGGRHATTPLSVQEFLWIPEAETTETQLLDVKAAFKALQEVLEAKQVPVTIGYEGGFTAPLASHQAVFEALQEGAAKANVRLQCAIDAASSEFFDEKAGTYHLLPEELTVDQTQLVEIYQSWTKQFPLVLMEDAMAEDDWKGWEILGRALGDKVKLIGDDFLTTNLERIQQAYDRKIPAGVLLKPNQIGSVTETVEARQLAEKHNQPTVLSHRSGETMDSFIADLSVALGTDYIKAGAPLAPVRAAKYDRLLAIARELHA